jgi:cytochrome c
MPMTKQALAGGAAALILAALSCGQAQAEGDAAAGKAVFDRVCGACHVLQGDSSDKPGPSLHGIVGHKAGSDPKFDYSTAMAGASVVWTPETLDKFITNPRSVVPGNKMTYSGMRNAKQRQDLVAFLAAEGAAK